MNKEEQENSSAYSSNTMSVAEFMDFSYTYLPFIIAISAIAVSVVQRDLRAAIMLAGVASLLCGRTIARFASRWSSAGSLLTYATVSLGPSWGLYSGITYTMAMSLLTVGGVAFLAHFAETFFQFHTHFSGLILACVTSLIIGLICYQGVQISTRVQLLVTAVSAFFVLLLGTVIIVQRSMMSDGVTHTNHKTTKPSFPGVFSRLLESMLPTTAPSFPGFCKGTLSALLIFAGYESAAAFGVFTIFS